MLYAITVILNTLNSLVMRCFLGMTFLSRYAAACVATLRGSRMATPVQVRPGPKPVVKTRPRGSSRALRSPRACDAEDVRLSLAR